MKKPALPITALLLLFSLTMLPGCPTTTKPAAGTATKQGPKTNLHRQAITLLRQAPDAQRCREALQLLNTHLQHQPDLVAARTLDAETRKFLQQHAGLSNAEFEEVASPSFRPADAHYLAECFLLRDAARALQIGALSPAEAARHCFGWVQRHVLLHQQGDDWLPPALVLRRGYGSARDRALVFLALLRQLRVHDQAMEGCLFTLPAAPDAVVLVGVLAPLPKANTEPAGPRDVYLFDPRLGSPVRSANHGVATLKDALADGKPLEPSGLTVEQLKTAQVRLVCPLTAIAPRMRALEKDLAAHERIVLSIDPANLTRQFTEAGLPARLWNAAGGPDKSENSPMRALRLFLPADEGGTDTDNRRKLFESTLVPIVAMAVALEQTHLGESDLGRSGVHTLLLIETDLCRKYDVQPREMLLRGKSEEAIQRLHRARSFLEDENLSGLADNPDFQEAVADWRGQAIAAYAALAAKAPNGQAQVNGFWAEDQYLQVLLQPDLEVPPEHFPKKTLTRIVAHGTRDYLIRRAQWLRATLWQEKAERDQLLANRAAAGNAAAAAARPAWTNTRVAWNLYLDRAALGPSARQQQLLAIHAHMKRQNTVQAAHLLEDLHLELRQYCAARLNQARAVAYAEGPKAAAALLKDFDEDLTALLEKGMQPEIDAVRPRLNPSADAALIRSLDLLGHDWAPRGNYYWFQQQIRRQLKMWEPS
jgi:hypothetical protein